MGTIVTPAQAHKKLRFKNKIVKDFKINKSLYLLVLPVILFYIIFHYGPMYGTVIAFKNFSPAKGIWASEWVGIKHFVDFVNSYYFWRILRNTLVISFSTLIFGFPAPIILALLINELRNKLFKRSVQTISYLPHFISIVVICGMIKDFTMDTGLINHIMSSFGWEPVTMLTKPKMFVPIFVISQIWQEIGWGSIIYLAALTAINPELYEASRIDGAGKIRQTWHITLPGILPTITILFILRIGHIMDVSYEKIILLYNPTIYETADVISTYIYRKGLQDFSFSYSAAVGLFNAVINFALIMVTNKICRRYGTSLW
jgi:putative aldouronate transport system permease protein